MADPLLWHRLQFAFTIVYHYLFPQLTMGLALVIVVLKGLAARRGGEAYAVAARFWVRVFGLNFAVGVVTGIPMEFQFGTNWARFSAVTGGVIGQTLALEGMFAFFLESSFLAMLVWGEQKLGPRKHFFAALALFVGSWLSGVFIVTTNAFMQHPVGFARGDSGVFALSEFWTYLLNPWALAQYAHNQMASVVTASFVVSAVGAFWLLRGTHLEQARLNLKVGTIAGLIASTLVAFPTGDLQAKLVANHQPASLAAMEGRFESGTRASIHLIGQPNVEQRRLDNPIGVPLVLSFLAFGRFNAEVQGLNDFPERDWPDNIELLYYSFHVMVGLGTMFIGLMALAVLARWRGWLERTRPLLWVLMLAFPFPYIANTAGWMTAELGRQPWLVYGLLRTSEGMSPTVHAGSTLFTLIGFAGLYFVLGIAFLFLVGREVLHGPELDHAQLSTIWFWLIALMLTMWAVLDGFDFGAGVLHRFVAKTDLERREVLAAIGPVWDGNEVWLIAAGGSMFLAFPRLIAAGFSGFYLPVIFVVWALLLRGLSIELRSHLGSALWRSFFDTTFMLASFTVPVLMGALLGNVVRGVPLDASGFFELALFPAEGEAGVLDGYSLLCGLFVLVTLTAHGANWLVWKTSGVVQRRVLAVRGPSWLAAAVLWLASAIATSRVAPIVMTPIAWAGLVLSLGGAVTVFVKRGAERAPFFGGAAFIVGQLVTIVACVFPVVLRASGAGELSLTVTNSSSGPIALRAGLFWWGPGVFLAAGYLWWVLRHFRGKVNVAP